MTDFSKFENRYVITGKIVLETPLRIGSQRPRHSTSSAALLMRETPEGFVPFIPGSSLKGVLRSSCERIVKTFGADERIINEIFGFQEAGAKIRVRDCDAVNYNEIEERIHCATGTEKYCTIDRSCKNKRNCVLQKGYYKVKVFFNKKKGCLEPKTNPVPNEEYIPPSVSFNFCMELDNASEQDVGMVLLGLDEFKHKRAYLGGGVSRGYGFVDVEGLKVEEIKLKNFDFEPENINHEKISKFKENIIEFLKENKSKPKGKEFEFYNNTIVCSFDVSTITDFEMAGVDEQEVKVGGYAVIPGSTIKGFLRHSCYYTPNIKGKTPELLGCKEPKINWEARKVDKIFGSMKQRSKILVSDAFVENKKEKIVAGDKLKCWIAFDNVDDNDIEEIIDFLKDENTITGKTSSKGEKNRVEFELKQAYRFNTESENFCEDVTSNFKK